MGGVSLKTDGSWGSKGTPCTSYLTLMMGVRSYKWFYFLVSNIHYFIEITEIPIKEETLMTTYNSKIFAI